MTEETLFANALEKKTPADRAAFLDEACAGDPALRQRVEALCRSHEQAEFLKKPAVQIAAEAVAGVAIDSPAETLTGCGDDNAVSLDFLAPSDKPDSLGRLGHYEVLEVIGRGAMGIVLRAFDEKLHRVVAIKVMAPELAATSPPRKRFLREARSAAAVHHEHVVVTHGVEEQPIPYLVMEYVCGETLQQRLDRVGPLELCDVLRLGQQIASGLAEAHRLGLIHRDIKPSNILIAQGIPERVKITDFGLARAVDDASLTQSGVIAGTPMYMAPEQTEGEAIDHRADLFSLGSVLYTMSSGRPPFRATTSMATLRRVAESAPRPIREIIPEVPEWLCEIIAKLHAKSPEDRFQSAKDVADLLGRCLTNLEQGQLATMEELVALSDVPRAAGHRKAETETAPPVTSGVWRFRGRRWAIAASVLLVLCGGLSFSEATGVTNLHGTVIRIFTTEGTLVVESVDPAVKVTIEGDGGLVINGAGPQEVRLRPGSYKLQAAKDGKPVRLDQELVTITRGGKRVVRVAVEPNKLAGPASSTFVTPWTDSDSWVLEGEDLVQPNDLPGWHTIYFGDVSWTDYNFEADVKIIDRAYKVGLFFRATDPYHVLVAELHPAIEGVRDKAVRGVLSRNGKDNPIYVHSLVVGETIKGRSYHVRVEARGDNFTMFVDGARVTSVHSEDHPRGCVGLLTESAARFRNLKVTDPGGKVLLEGFDKVLPKPKAAPALADKSQETFTTPWSDSDDWVIEGQELVLPDSQQAHVLLFGDPSWTDYNFEADVQVTGGGDEVDLTFRARDPGHRLAAILGGFGNTRNGLLAAVPGLSSEVRLVPGQTQKGRWYRVQVEVRGNRYKMYLDGTRILSGHHEQYPRGCVGFATNGAGARFRNMKVTDPKGRVLLEGFDNVLPKPKAASASLVKGSAKFTTPWLDSDDWVIEGNELHQRDESHAGHLVFFGDPNWTDYDIEAEVKVGPGDFNEAGLVFRATRSDDRLYGCIGAFGNVAHAMLSARNGFGAFAQTPGKAEKNRWYRLRVETRGGRFNMFLDGKRILTGRNDGFPRGRVGLITVGASARFRNLKVTDPKGKTLLEGLPPVLPRAKDLADREVGAVLRETVRLESDDDEAHFALGIFYAQWGEWKKAGIEYDRGLELNPADPARWMHAAGIHLAAGDLEGYRRACREMLQRFGDTGDALTAERTASVCLLLPDAVSSADYERVQKLAEIAVTGTEKHGFYRYFLRTKALADYRAERFAEAVKCLEKSAPMVNRGPDDASMFAILSMALHSLGRTEEAQAALANAKAIAAKLPDPARGQPQGGVWLQYLIARHECHLAESLLNKD